MKTRPERITRFTRTERAFHWIHALAFFGMLGTGLILYVPALSEWISRRNQVKNIHLLVAVVWVVSLVAVVLVGNRSSLRRTWREVETFDRDDRRWLTGRKAPQGRINAGQKMNTLFSAAFALLFIVTGFFLWLGERDHAYLFEGTGPLHDLLTLGSLILLIGHLYLALIHPSTRHAIRGMTTGEVDLEWAAKHHSKWVAEERPVATAPEPGRAREKVGTGPSRPA
jgi:formate dehydrogenase subunit gamma